MDNKTSLFLIQSLVSSWCLNEAFPTLTGLFNRSYFLGFLYSDEDSLNAGRLDDSITKCLMYWKIIVLLKLKIILICYDNLEYHYMSMSLLTKSKNKCNFYIPFIKIRMYYTAQMIAKNVHALEGKANNEGKWLLLFLFMTLFNVLWLLERTSIQHIAIWNHIMKNTCLLMQELNWHFVIGKFCRINKDAKQLRQNMNYLIHHYVFLAFFILILCV